MFHRVYHYCVARAVFKRPTLQLASEYVKILLSLRILALSEEAKANLKNAIDKQPESAVLYGFIHEQCVHSQLKNQYDLVARQLVRSNAVRTARSVITSDPNKTGEPLLLKTPGTESVELESNFALADLAVGTYFTPKSKTMESIESIYLVKPDSTINAPRSNVDVVLFQATVSRSHPMKGSGLYNVLKQLQIAKNNFPKRVAVVFAVPKSRELSFMHQTIVTSQPLENSSPITAVKGIRTKIPNDLVGTKIRTKKAYEDAKKLLQKHESGAVTEGGDVHHLLDKIPQFVWGL